MKKDVCRTDWGTRFVTWINILCARVGVQVGAWLGLLLLVAPMQVLADGWTPADAGLVVDLKHGDRIMFSIWVDVDGDGVDDGREEEFFVCHYPNFTGGYYTYTNNIMMVIISN